MLTCFRSLTIPREAASLGNFCCNLGSSPSFACDFPPGVIWIENVRFSKAKLRRWLFTSSILKIGPVSIISSGLGDREVGGLDTGLDDGAPGSWSGNTERGLDVPKPLEQFAPAVGASTDLDLEVSTVTRRE